MSDTSKSGQSSKARRGSGTQMQEPPSALPGPGGAEIVAELEQRFKTLGQWHAQTREQFQAQKSALDGRAAALAQTQEEVEAAQREAQAKHEAGAKAKTKLEHDRAAFEAYCKGEEAALTKQRLACEEWITAQHVASEGAIVQRQARATEEIETARAEIKHQQQELAQVRAELDGEWDSVRMVRAAEDASLRAWQHAHERAQQTQLRLVPADVDTPEVPQAKAA